MPRGYPNASQTSKTIAKLRGRTAISAKRVVVPREMAVNTKMLERTVARMNALQTAFAGVVDLLGNLVMNAEPAVTTVPGPRAASAAKTARRTAKTSTKAAPTTKIRRSTTKSAAAPAVETAPETDAN